MQHSYNANKISDHKKPLQVILSPFSVILDLNQFHASSLESERRLNIEATQSTCGALSIGVWISYALSFMKFKSKKIHVFLKVVSGTLVFIHVSALQNADFYFRMRNKTRKWKIIQINSSDSAHTFFALLFKLKVEQFEGVQNVPSPKEK